MNKNIILMIVCCALMVGESKLVALYQLKDSNKQNSEKIEQMKLVQAQIVKLNQTIAMLSSLVNKGAADYNTRMKLVAIIKVKSGKKASLEALKKERDSSTFKATML